MKNLMNNIMGVPTTLANAGFLLTLNEDSSFNEETGFVLKGRISAQAPWENDLYADFFFVSTSSLAEWETFHAGINWWPQFFQELVTILPDAVTVLPKGNGFEQSGPLAIEHFLQQLMQPMELDVQHFKITQECRTHRDQTIGSQLKIAFEIKKGALNLKAAYDFHTYMEIDDYVAVQPKVKESLQALTSPKVKC